MKHGYRILPRFNEALTASDEDYEKYLSEYPEDRSTLEHVGLINENGSVSKQSETITIVSYCFGGTTGIALPGDAKYGASH